MYNPINIIFLGNLDSGKSTICSRLSNVERETGPTMGVEQSKIHRKYESGVQSQQIDIKLIDTSGDPHYMDLIQPELLHADAVMFVFAFNNQESYDDLGYWIELVEPFTDDYTTLMIVGNKSQDKQLAVENPQQLALQKEMLYSEISALYKIGLDEMLKQVVDSVLDKRRHQSAKKQLKIQSSAILKLKENRNARTMNIGIIGDPSIGKFRIFSKACRQFNAKDTIVPLFQGSLSQKAQIYFPHDEVIVELLDITDLELHNLLTNPGLEVPEALLIAFSTESRRSFENIETYMAMFQQNVRVILIGTKADSGKREISLGEFAKFANGKDLKYFQLSDKNNQPIETLFEYMICSQPKSIKPVYKKPQDKQETQTTEPNTNAVGDQRGNQRGERRWPFSFSFSLTTVGVVVGLGLLVYYKFIRK